jgi:hypothetical protein
VVQPTVRTIQVVAHWTGAKTMVVARGAVVAAVASRTRHLDNGQREGMRECLLHRIGSTRHERETSLVALASTEGIDPVMWLLVGRRKEESGTALHEGECERGRIGGWLAPSRHERVVCGRVE